MIRRPHLAVASLVLAALCLGAAPAAAQAASPAWQLLAATGPTNLPPRQSEVQGLTVEAQAGSFALTATTARGSGTLSFASGFGSLTAGSNEAQILAAGEGAFAPGQEISGAGIPAGTTIAAVAGSTLTLSENATESGPAILIAASREVAGVASSFGAFHVGDALTGAGLAPGTTIEAVGPTTLTLSQLPVAAGSPQLTATETTAPILAGAPASGAGSVLSGLEALPGIGPGAVTVFPEAEAPSRVSYRIAFGGLFAEADVEQLAADGGALTGEHPNVEVATLVPGGPGSGEIAIYPTNIGGAATAGPITVELGPLPIGIVTAAGAGGTGWNCTGAAGGSSVSCEREDPVPALANADPILVPVRVESAFSGSTTVRVTVSGGGAAAARAYDAPITVSATPAPPGIQGFWAGAFDADGKPSTQAGGHPFSALTNFLLNSKRSALGDIVPAGDIRDVVVDLPPGFVGNPLITGRCPQSMLVPPLNNDSPLCGDFARVGNFSPVLQSFGTGTGSGQPIFNDVPATGSAAEFTTVIGVPTQSLLGSVRSEEDFGVSILAPTVSNFFKVYGSFVALVGQPTAAGGRAFLTNPTDCGEEARVAPVTTIEADSYQQQGVFSRAVAPQPPVTGCEFLRFAPSFELQPTSTRAATAVGVTARLHIPQEGLTDPLELATPALRKAVVTLPPGLTLNPASASGLQACSQQQVGLKGSGFPLPHPIRFDEAPVSCPEASKLGTVEVKSPLLEQPLQGTIYLAAQEANPFGSLIALYLVVDDARTGIVMKLAGKVEPDPDSGRLTTTFDNNPQLPFEDLTLRFRGDGPRAVLASPEICGTHKATGELTPWSAPQSGPPAPISEAGFTASGPCAASVGARPFSPRLEAGTERTGAGAFSPLVIRVAREDGEQELRHLDFTLPEGLLARLAGIPYCSEAAIAAAGARSGRAERADPSCPAASRLGSVEVAAGVGSAPIRVGGSVYLAGPYKGAPISALVITPAVAGPFDLGDVVVRTPLFVDLETSQVTARSDALPTILRGIPLKLRSVAISLDRPGFVLNPTSCDPTAVTASLTSGDGATAKRSSRFQVGGCRKMPFKPRLKLRLTGPTRRSGHPALKAVVTFPKRGRSANIARAQVGLPHSEFLDQGNLSNVCTQGQLKSKTCPRRSIYGHAKAWSPLLDKPLEGPVYLGVGYGHKLPDLVADLDGQIRVLLHGRVDTTKRKGLRNTFEVVPDAPVSRFVLQMRGGKKKGLMENSENLCRKAQRANARFVGQNGKVLQLHPRIATDCKQRQRRG